MTPATVGAVLLMPTSDAVPRERALVAIALLSVFAYLLVSAREPLRLNWGDPWSDANVLTALNYSSTYGFLKTSFTDVLDVGPLTVDSYRYTHYPPFAEIFYGCIRKICGGAPLDISVYRVFAIGFGGLGLLGLFRYVSGVWGHRMALWATVLCATNLLWLQFADSIHQSPVLFASGMTVLAAVPGWTRTRRRTHTVALSVGTYICFLTAYDYYFFLPSAVLLTARVLGVPLWSKKMVRLAGIVAASGALAIATKSVFVAGALGWSGFVEDIHFQFLERATTTFSPDYRSGFSIVIFARWLSYFTPVVFVAAVALTIKVVRNVGKLGARGAIRALLYGSDDLAAHPGSILILLTSALPFIVVFSELSVEQVLPSQVILPFYSVACAYCIVWVGTRRSLGSSAALAAFGAILAWQAVHFARVPKAFLERETAAQIRDYLAKNDTADFVVTNLMADGPIQYFFDRHLNSPADVVARARDGYSDVSNKTRSGIVHAVYFEDPNSRFIDKSLWALLTKNGRWGVFGAPYVFRQQALDAISEWDGRVLAGLEGSGSEVMRFPGVRVFRVGTDLPTRLAESAKEMTQPTRYIDFGVKEAVIHKLSGFRWAENYPNVPGFCWTVGLAPHRTVLTKRGLVYRQDVSPTYEALLLVRFAQLQDEKVSLITWGSINDQTLSATIQGVTVLPSTNLGPGQTRSEISFVVPKHLQAGEPTKVITFKFRDVAEFGGGVAFGIMRIEPSPDR